MYNREDKWETQEIEHFKKLITIDGIRAKIVEKRRVNDPQFDNTEYSIEAFNG